MEINVIKPHHSSWGYGDFAHMTSHEGKYGDAGFFFFNESTQAWQVSFVAKTKCGKRFDNTSYYVMDDFGGLQEVTR